MAGVGSACLTIGLLTALHAAGASVYGAVTGRRQWVTSGRRAIYCLAALCVAAFAILESAFLRSDFSYKLVAEGSSTLACVDRDGRPQALPEFLRGDGKPRPPV